MTSKHIISDCHPEGAQSIEGSLAPNKQILLRLWRLRMTFFLMLLLLPLSLFASTASSCAKLVEKTYSNTNALVADFTQTTVIEITGQTINRKGKFYFAKGGKFRIEYLSNPKKIYSSDGKKLYVYFPNDLRDMIIEDLNSKTIPPAALSFLQGFHDLSKDFDVETNKSFEDNNNNNCALSLKPKKDTTYEKLDALFNKNGFLEKLIIHNRSGNISDYVFSKIKKKNKLSDKLFRRPK